MRGVLLSLSFTECSFSSSCLTFEALNLPYQLEFSAERGVYPSWTSVMRIRESETGGPMRIKAICGAFTCVYEMFETEVPLTPGGGGRLQMNLPPTPMALTTETLGCPVTIQWSGQYEFASPEPLYVIQH